MMKGSLLEYVIEILILFGFVYIYNLSTFSASRYHNKGVREFEAKNYDKAKKYFQRAIENSDAYVHSYNWIAAVALDSCSTNAGPAFRAQSLARNPLMIHPA